MYNALPILPVSDVMPALLAALDADTCAVLAAPPGAGKTTLVPLHLLSAPWRGDGKIIVLEPRRLAARASARQMARLIGEDVGGTIGFRTRLDTRVSARTRIEVVTEGIFVRMLLDDPELPGVAAVLFDEFHERTLDADFGLALALDIQQALREDLRILVMSATLDVERVSRLMGGAAAVESTGRAFPIDVRYQERRHGMRIETAVCDGILNALRQETGSILAFLPGQAEIRRTAELLEKASIEDATITPLYGDLSAAAQDQAIRAPAAGERKIVLATAIAETSITIDGVRIVIDSGLQRLPVFEPSTGITRLETVRVSKASADQRAGRAGRTEPGIAIRLWRREQTAALADFTPPQILSTDLSNLLLDCCAWGVSDPAAMAFIDPPPEAAINEARVLLHSLGALDEAGQLTADGRLMRQLGLPTRLAAVVIAADRSGLAYPAAELAVLMGERGLGGNAIDLDVRWQQFRASKGPREQKARALARRIASTLPNARKTSANSGPVPGAASLLLHGFSDRVARRRGQADTAQIRYGLANGRGAFVEDHAPLAQNEFLVVADLTGKIASQRILSAAPIDRITINEALAEKITREEAVSFVTKTKSVKARKQLRLGRLVLEETPLANPSAQAIGIALEQGLQSLGIDVLPWSPAAKQLRQRIKWLHLNIGPPWPAMDDKALLSNTATWFTPFQNGITGFADISAGSLTHGLMALLPYTLHSEIDRLAPTHFKAPTGSSIPIRYEGDEPVLAIRVQELFGLKQHPSLANGQVPLLLELLSPAQRPIQTTRDLPGFWQGSWADVRAEMRGRYPRHPWPEDPSDAEATRRVKHPRKR